MAQKPKKNIFNRIAGSIKKKPSTTAFNGSLLLTIASACALPLDGGISIMLMAGAYIGMPSTFIFLNYDEIKDNNKAAQKIAAPRWAVKRVRDAEAKILKAYEDIKDEAQRDAKVNKILAEPKLQKALGAVKILDENDQPIKGAEFKFMTRPKKVKTTVVEKVVQEQEVWGESKQDRKKPKALPL